MIEDTSEISNLVQRIHMVLDNKGHSLLAFISARSGEGTSTIARSFTETLALETQRKCLLVDAGPLDKTRFILDGMNSDNGLVEAALSGPDAANAAQLIEENAYLARWCGDDKNRGKAGQLARDKQFWSELKTQFDTIILDAPSLQTSSDGLAFAAQADAVIMVIEAEATREAVAINLRDTLIAAGANIIGSVMNKRRRYIPEKLYKRL